VLKAVQLLVTSNCIPQKDMESVLPLTEKILKHYIVSGQEIYLEYPLDILKHLVSFCSEVDSIWEAVVDLQSHEDVVIREKAEDLIE
jgi:hypothetical protein